MKKNIILIGILFLFLPICIDKFIMNKFITNWSMGEWAGFLGSYLGSGLGLLGIFLQIQESERKDKRNKIIGILKYLNYNLEKNLLKKNLKKDKIFLLNYISFRWREKNFFKILYPFDEEILREIKIIFELSFGKEIYDLKEKIEENNNFFNENLEILVKKREIFEKLLSNEGESFQTIREIDIQNYNFSEKNELFKYLILLFMISRLIGKIIEISSYDKGKIEITTDNFKVIIDELKIEKENQINKLLTIKNLEEKKEFTDEEIDIVVGALFKILEQIINLNSDKELNKALVYFRQNDFQVNEKDFTEIKKDIEKLQEKVNKELNKLE